MTRHMKNLVFTGFILFCLLVLGIAGFLNYKGLEDTSHILEDSITAQLTSIISAAKEIIDPETFTSYVDTKSIGTMHYERQLEQLRLLAKNTGADYIYALKYIDGESVFIFDTDIDDEPFLAYELAPMMEEAFAGQSVSGISNVVDEYGSYSTAAAPIKFGGEVVGIVCIDLEDQILNAHRKSARNNVRLMLGMLAVVLSMTCIFAYHLLDKMRVAHEDLAQLANYDRLTQLPNRQYLLSTLATLTAKQPTEPFALLFIDLDNFKRVNDNAGHDAGDALLKSIGDYLNQSLDQTKVFRPGAGLLNVAARIGGDEFVLIVNGVDDISSAEQVAHDLLDGFRTEEINRYVQKYQVGLSIGIAMFPYHATDYNVLIKYADIAMYHAKKAGKNNYMMYEDEMEDKSGK